MSASEAADAEMRRLRMQETILATSQAHISLHARSAQLRLSQPDIAAICQLSDSFAAWRNELAEAALLASGGNGLPPAAQIVFEMEACVQATLEVIVLSCCDPFFVYAKCLRNGGLFSVSFSLF